MAHPYKRWERLLGGKLGRNLEEFVCGQAKTSVDRDKGGKGGEGEQACLSSRLERFLGGKLGCDLEEFDRRKARRAANVDHSGHVADNIYHWEPKSFRIQAINWYHVLLAEYLHYGYKLLILLVFLLIASQVNSGTFELARARSLASDPMLLELIIMAALIIAYIGRMKPSVFCMENCVFVPPSNWRVTKQQLITMMRAQDCFADNSIDFLNRVLDSSGTGESTAWPPSILASLDGVTKASSSVLSAREEAKAVVFPLVREVLERTGIKPEDIDFLIVNCSLFSPTPSLCALLCNEFCLREDVRTYNLGGMGCSANIIAVDLAKQLLQNEPGTRALIVSTENLTQNLYKGNEKAMLLQNTLFRCGGCALLLSSRRVDAVRAKYKLLYTFRAQVSEDKSYKCVFQQPDAEGNVGVALSKDIVNVAGRAMKRNFIQLGPYVLPLREQAKVLYNRCAITLLTRAKRAGRPFLESLTIPQGYTPNFGKGIEHFCIHAGGRAVIEGVQKNLALTDDQVRPSLQTLYEFGNTSSSSVWYEADWAERHGAMKRGDRMLQIAFGSGFKCNSAVWVALRVDASKIGAPLKTP